MFKGVEERCADRPDYEERRRIRKKAKKGYLFEDATKEGLLKALIAYVPSKLG